MRLSIERINITGITNREKLQDYLLQNLKDQKIQFPNIRSYVQLLKAFIFSLRSNVYNYAPASWSIIEEPEVGWLGELVAEPSSIFRQFFKHSIDLTTSDFLETDLEDI